MNPINLCLNSYFKGERICHFLTVQSNIKTWTVLFEFPQLPLLDVGPCSGFFWGDRAFYCPMFTVHGGTFIPLCFLFDKLSVVWLFFLYKFSSVFQQAFDAGPQSCVQSVAWYWSHQHHIQQEISFLLSFPVNGVRGFLPARYTETFPEEFCLCSSAMAPGFVASVVLCSGAFEACRACVAPCSGSTALRGTGGSPLVCLPGLAQPFPSRRAAPIGSSQNPLWCSVLVRLGSSFWKGSAPGFLVD